MDRACSMYEGLERCIQGFGGEPERRNPLEDLGIDGRIILKWVFEQWNGGMDWISLAQDRDRSWALVNGVMNLWVS